MSIDDDLTQQIQEAQKKMNEAAKNLESFSTIKETLNETEAGLKLTIDGINKIANEIQSALDALKQSAIAIENIANTLKSLEPEKVYNELSNLKNLVYFVLFLLATLFLFSVFG